MICLYAKNERLFGNNEEDCFSLFIALLCAITDLIISNTQNKYQKLHTYESSSMGYLCHKKRWKDYAL